MGVNKKLNFHFFAMAALGKGLSGGDRIFIELARRWSKKYPVTIYVWEEGREMCRRQSLVSKRIKYKVWRMKYWGRLGFVICYLARVVRAVIESFKLKLKNKPTTIVYSASDFWMDSLPGWILKMRFPNITWIGTFYLAAPNPFTGFREQGEIKIPSLKNIVYWLMQQPIYFLIRSWADLVFVTSDPDAKRFPKHNRENRIVVVRGGVDISRAREWKSKRVKVSKIYDAVFQGRFHPQKGVVELIDIWRKVVGEKPKAKLAMIGDGPLMQNVKLKIKNEKLEKNIKLFGYVFDGPKKYRIFSQSRVFIHPAIYDSGGMSAAEGMVWGLPAVSFDLEALKTYYPKGVLKARIGDLDDFANKILTLLEDKKLYRETAEKAVALVKDYWDWDARAKDVLGEVKAYVEKT